MANTRKKKDQEPDKSEPEQQTLGVEPEILSPIEDPDPPIEQIDNKDTAEPTDDAPSVEPEPAKRRPGRPSKTDPPVLRSGIIERINNLTSWDGTRVYCYRWEPFTDRKAGGKQSVMVKRYDGPFDEQDVLEDPGMGSGVYEFVVNRTDPQTRQRRIIDSGMVRLLNMKYPPRIPQKEWVDDERNKDWEWARNVCDKTEAPGAVPVAPATDPLVEILRDQLVSSRQEMTLMRQEIRETANKKDPHEQSVLTVLLQKFLEKPAPPPPPPADPVRDMLMTYLMKQLDSKSEPPKPADPAAELERILDIQAKIEERMGGGRNAARSRKTGTQEMITDIAAAVGPALTPIVQVIAAGMLRQQQQAGQQQPQPQAPQQVAISPGIDHAAMQPPTPPQGPQLVKTAPTIQALADAVLDHLRRRAVGLDLGDWYIEQFGMEEFNELRLQGKPKLVADLQTTPQWAEIAHHGMGELDKLLSEFITWQPEESDDEDEDEDDEPPAGTTPNGWTQPQEVKS